ncbi:MAG: DUF3465 domain-containing protein [Candidatus Obscuribacterales bacterium]|nr:DUF3465 domain-containing protein [Steroidobacteraceae bacterium]
MRRWLLVLVAAGALYWSITQTNIPAPAQTDLQPAPQSLSRDAGDVLRRAFETRQSNVQVQASGVVVRVLTDDNDGSRHQRFIVKLPDAQTVLIAHNIDLAPRVSPLAEGDRVEFFGEYDWNDKGGVVHWTHRDPANKHIAGWIKRDGQSYQ